MGLSTYLFHLIFITIMKKILICEDDSIARMLLVIYLNKDFILKEAKDGRESMEFIQNEDFDLMLFDFELPYFNGIELIKFTRNQAKKTTPILMMTAHSDIMKLGDMMSSGANDYIIKPFGPSLLTDKINFLLK